MIEILTAVIAAGVGAAVSVFIPQLRRRRRYRRSAASDALRLAIDNACLQLPTSQQETLLRLFRRYKGFPKEIERRLKESLENAATASRWG